MCLYLKKNARLMTAKKPIHIYKLLYITPIEKRLVTPYRFFPVEFNKKGTLTMKAKLGEKERVYLCTDLRKIEEGIHAYSKYRIAKNEVNDLSADKLYPAVIPAGATYYNSEDHFEVVADKIIVFETYELYKKYMAKWDK